MNKFEYFDNWIKLKTKLNKTYRDISNVTEIMAMMTEFSNKDVSALIDRSVSSVKDHFTVQTIDIYAKKLTTYTQEFLSKLDKLGVDWLICHLPVGVNYYSDEKNHVFSEPFNVQSDWASSHIKQIKKEGKGKTFMMYGVYEATRESVPTYTIRGKLVRKSIFVDLLQE